jgi:hypothetical protein
VAPPKKQQPEKPAEKLPPKKANGIEDELITIVDTIKK